LLLLFIVKTFHASMRLVVEWKWWRYEVPTAVFFGGKWAMFVLRVGHLQTLLSMNRESWEMPTRHTLFLIIFPIKIFCTYFEQIIVQFLTFCLISSFFRASLL
jgi:hypothetical protein